MLAGQVRRPDTHWIGACRGASPICVTNHPPFAKGGLRGIGLGGESDGGHSPMRSLDSRLRGNDRRGVRLHFSMLFDYTGVLVSVCLTFISITGERGMV